MVPTAETERDRARVNADALARLIEVAEQLRRTNATKWQLTRAEWDTAVRAIMLAPAPQPHDSISLAQAIRAAQSVGRRLRASGEARFGSATVGRQPNSSFAGKRFDDDIRIARKRLVELQQLADA